jgi:hypothetical protein
MESHKKMVEDLMDEDSFMNDDDYQPDITTKILGQFVKRETVA